MPKPNTEQLFRTNAELTIEAARDGNDAARVSIVAYNGGKIDVRGIGPAVLDLSGLELPESKNVVLLADHFETVNGVLGWVEPSVNDHTLRAEGRLSRVTDAGKTVIGLHRDGVRFQASMGAAILESEHVRADEQVNVNGQTVTAGPGGLLLVRRSALKEISILPLAADDRSSVAIAASRGKTMPQDNTNNDTTPGPSGQQDQNVKAGANDPVTAFREEQAKESERIAEIRKLCAGRSDDIEVKAIRGGWDAEKVTLEIERSDRPNPPLVSPRNFDAAGGWPDEGRVLRASLCMSAGMGEKFVGEQYGEKVMNEALSASMRGAGIHTILRYVLRAAGQPHSFERLGDTQIRGAFEADRMLRAAGGFSTISLPGILGDVANKAMLEAYQAVPTSWNEIAAVADNRDFKPHKRFRLVGKGKFQKVGKDGELKHITLDEQKYESQLETTGAIIALPRQTIINDDVGAFLQLPRVIGRMGAISLEREVYTLWLSNPDNFFHNDNGNLITGGSSALGIDSVSELEAKMLSQVDENGDPLLLMMSVMLVPPQLRSLAFQLANSTEIRGGSGKQPVNNPHFQRFKPVWSPWLNTPQIAGGSATAWYLTSDPASGVAAIEVAFLNGMRNPTVESGDTNFDTLGMQFRGFWDYAVAMQDFRAAGKSDGQ